jgi:superfamily II DNA or RNA helicase
MSAPQILRPYQEDCVRAILMAWERRSDRGRIRALGSLATGGGKTTIIGELLRRSINPQKQRALIFVHRREIVHQIRDRVANQFAELEPTYSIGGKLIPGIGIVMADYHDYEARIVVASQQSLHMKRLERLLQAGKFDVAIMDESHHYAPDNFCHHILQRLIAENPDIKIAGFTATPKRSDRRALRAGFDEIVYEWSILDGIAGKYLVPATRLRVTTGVDLSSIKSVNGDYQKNQMLSILDAANWLDRAMDAYQTYLHGKRRHILAFLPSVQMSRAFAKRLNAAGIPAAHIDATTPIRATNHTDRALTRPEILRAFQTGELEVVCNYNVLTEGVDFPMTDAIIDARPSRSDVVKTQMWGRGLRPAHGKTDCLILDLTVADVNALDRGTLLGKTRQCGQCGAQFFLGFKACPNCHAIYEPPAKIERGDGAGQFIRHSKRILMGDLQAEIVPLFDKLSSAWFRADDGTEMMSSAVNDGALVIVPPSFADPTRLRERLRKGDYLLPRLDDPEDRKELLHQMGILRRQVERCEAYTLYYVHDREVEFIRANTDLASLVAEADMEALRRAGGNSYLTKKSSRWRTPHIPATLKQINMLRYILRLPAQIWSQRLSKDQAARLITHYKAAPFVRNFIENDCLPEAAIHEQTA